MASQPKQQFVWPGFGLVMGAGIGALVGVLFFPANLAIAAGAGAGIGLVAGAAIDSQKRGTGDRAS